MSLSTSASSEPSRYVTPSTSVFLARLLETKRSKNKSYLIGSTFVTRKR